MSANPAFKDRVRYTLFNEQMGSIVVQEPEGWETDDKELTRHEQYHGIFPKFSNALKFHDDGADYIKLVYDVQGIEADIRLTKQTANPQTDIMELAYYGNLDLTTYEIDKKVVSVKFNNAGFETILKARESEKVEVTRLTTMDGAAIDPLRIDTVQLNGRNILLDSRWKTDSGRFGNTVAAQVYIAAGSSSGGTDREQVVGVPIKLVVESHENAQSISDQTVTGPNQGTTGIMFFANSDRDRRFKLKLDMSFLTNVYQKDDTENEYYILYITKYSNGTDYNVAQRYNLFDTTNLGGIGVLGGTALGTPPGVWNVNYENDFELLQGQSLSLQFFVHANLGGTLSDGSLGINAFGINANMSIVEDSYAEPSQSKFILAFELANRLVQIMTGRNRSFKSSIFGRTDIGYTEDGRASLNGYSHGFWIRNFDSLPISTANEINPFKPLTTSFKEFISSNEAIWNIGLGIEQNGYSETIVIEDKRYFYDNNVRIRLPNQVSDVKRSVAPNYYYSGVDIGYAKGGDYEEAMGLDEYNARSTFTTFIKRLKNTYSEISDYRADSYGKEFARRKPYNLFPTEDSSYDNDIFIQDLKRNEFDNGTNTEPQYIFEERKWQDDFEQSPIGVYSPETATNLRFSPFNMLLRHGWVIGSGLKKYANEFLRYASSTANSGLITKLIGGVERAENGNIQNSELERSRYLPETIEFIHPITPELMRQIEGYTIVDNKRKPNIYGLIEFIDENNDIQKGYLLNLKPNDGKFKLLIANR